MSGYGWILIISVFLPTVLSFHPKIMFYKKWGRALLAGMIVAIPFWIWDIKATHGGDWRFNPVYVSQIKFFGLPIEEILFFIIIPFCCLFMWEVLNNLASDRLIKSNYKYKWIFIFFLMTSAALWHNKNYTFNILGAAMMTWLIVKKIDGAIFYSTNYWKWILLSFVPFLAVNGWLTYMPAVIYSDKAIIGIKLGTIPVEDFLYSWSWLTLNLVAYRKLKNKQIENSKYI